METWRSIPGFPSYEVSDYGNVRRADSHALLNINMGGWRRKYRYVWLRADKGMSRSVSRLVLLAFRGPPPDGHQARHLNGIHDDDRLDNLAWGTKSENERDKREHGTWWRTGIRKLTPDDIQRVFELYAAGETQTAIAQKMGVSQVQISRIVRGKTWALLQGSEDRVDAVADVRANAKLTPDDVRRIRRSRDEGDTLDALARAYGVSTQAIWRIAKRRTWRHVT